MTGIDHGIKHLSKEVGMFSLTKEEQLLIAVIIMTGLLGGLVMVWRDSQASSKPITESQMVNQDEEN